MDYLRTDCILREILEERKSLTGFLDAIFGFMSRNTDFYHIQKTKEDKLGFPRGVKEQILMSCMQKYEQPELASDLLVEIPSLVAEEVEIVTEENSIQNSDSEDGVKQDNIEMLETLTFNEIDYKNGSVFENYCWSQTLKDVELNVILPKDVKLAKHIKAVFKSNQISIRTLLPKEEILIDAETWDKFRHNDVIWSIADGKLIVNFDKLKECWWDKLFLCESAIDIKTVDTEQPLSEYSQETKNAIQNIKIQEDLKTLPLNESEQMTRLRQAWNAEGSPFKGQPFDPSVVKFN